MADSSFRDLNSSDDKKTLPIQPWDFSAAIVGDLRIRRTRIAGACVLTFTKVSGEIDLQDSTIGGDLQVASTITHDSMDADEEVRKELKKQDPMEAQYRTSCHRFRMRTLRCENGVDLTGLDLRNDGDTPRQKREGCIDAQHIEVKGDLRIYHRDEAYETYVRFPGCLDLSYSSLKRLVMSAHSFPFPEGTNPDTPSHHKKGFVLDRARISHLEIPEIESKGFPNPITLADISVSVWDIQSANNQLSKRYIHFMKNDSFRRSTYRAVEQSLRNQGHDEEADAIYRAMEDRAWDSQSSRRMRLGSIWHWLYKKLMGYGTDLTWLMGSVFLLMVLAFPVYTNPVNFEASSSFLAEQPTAFNVPCQPKPGERCSPPTHGERPAASEWALSHAFAMLIRNHVPVAPLVMKEDWEARDEACLAYFGKSGCSVGDGSQPPLVEVPWLSPEDFANIMQLINWMCWPLLLAFIVRRLLRQ